MLKLSRYYQDIIERLEGALSTLNSTNPNQLYLEGVAVAFNRYKGYKEILDTIIDELSKFNISCELSENNDDPLTEHLCILFIRNKGNLQELLDEMKRLVRIVIKSEDQADLLQLKSRFSNNSISAPLINVINSEDIIAAELANVLQGDSQELLGEMNRLVRIYAAKSKEPPNSSASDCLAGFSRKFILAPQTNVINSADIIAAELANKANKKDYDFLRKYLSHTLI